MQFPRIQSGAVALLTSLVLGGCDDGPTLAEAGRQGLLDPALTLRCDGVAEGGTVGGVEVRRGDECILTDVTVRGNVKVREGASLVLLGGRVMGNVEGDQAFAVEVRGTRVDGNIQVQKGRIAIVIDAQVGGNIQIDDNDVLTLELSGNEVRGNVQVTKNRGPGNKLVAGNFVAQNLQCHENGSPFLVGDNIAGDKEGQCR